MNRRIDREYKREKKLIIKKKTNDNVKETNYQQIRLPQNEHFSEIMSRFQNFTQVSQLIMKSFLRHSTRDVLRINNNFRT